VVDNLYSDILWPVAQILKTGYDAGAAADWVTWLVDLMVRWPVIVLIALAYLLWSPNAPRRLAAILKPFRSVKVFGTEIVLSEEAARELSVDAQEAFSAYRAKAKKEYDRLAEAYDLRGKLENLLIAVPALGKAKGIRCTIHVRDILFTESLYQVIDYYPSGGGRGRVKSMRFGMIGKVWRSGGSRIHGNVPTDAEGLIQDWGMTKEEAAAAGAGRKSFACILIEDKTHSPVGVIYADAPDADAFGPASTHDTVIDAVVLESQTRGLSEVLAEIVRDLRLRGPMIAIYD